MYESQIVEVKDMNFCHYINHFDEFDINYEEIFELEVAYDDDNEEDECIDY
ncbi:hypothetical protein [Sulfurimonas sp.]|uniref:hypothetical protein n=1 Tax=Sulfurimonas sp. TaxID=2022749 RepID=UPI003562918F